MSALKPVIMKILAEKVAAKENKGQYKVVLWNSIKDNPPDQLNFFPNCHDTSKTLTFWSNSRLFLLVKIKNGELLTSVTKSSLETAPRGDHKIVGKLPHANDPCICTGRRRYEKFHSKMGHQRWLLSFRLCIGRRMEFCIHFATRKG